MSIQQTTEIPEVQDTIVMLRQFSADEKIRQEVHYREKLLHDEATALCNARREGIEEGRAEGEDLKETEIIIKLLKKGKTPEQIADDLDISVQRVSDAIAGLR